MQQITLYYPISFESKEVLVEAQKYGKVFAAPANPDTREVHSELTSEQLTKFESFLTEHEIPYDLMKYSSGIEAPTMKKVRPEEGFEKEVACTFYQDGEEEVEQGMVAVSTLLSVIQNSSKNDLAKNVLEEIKKCTFKDDNIESIFEM
ncbi:hypothetical protein PP175_29430 (plasmid) [Aneurinibacillus sp. Ricciae_BoGa-3]|uniref:hypothetical protein n=1 Tax=Aneurinibacillus sp. Ricciae_BoGa-3 TaxID=3022697 RepID=UPI002340A9F1|nr:hypothetical protein [Aneurinibacillus sp. Ricciae_BoGa-3]WCK57314.1 hypothetical protein PP175_29430 [Aneurinibacillus sp. Ricciae_BoGa-3]